MADQRRDRETQGGGGSSGRATVANHQFRYQQPGGLQLKIHKLKTAVGTAGGDQLDVLGEVQDVAVWITRDCKLKIQRARVIPRLNHELNIGSEWLGENKATVDYGTNPPSMKVASRTVPMINNMEDEVSDQNVRPSLGRKPAVEWQPSQVEDVPGTQDTGLGAGA